VVTPDPDQRGAHLGVADTDPAALAAWLAGRGIAVSPRGPVIRVAFHYYNLDADTAAFREALRGYRAAHPDRHPSDLPSSGGIHVHS
jgi:selenocysteine lyase/cysteine desulfurase